MLARILCLTAACTLAATPMGCAGDSGARRIDDTTSTMAQIEALLDEGESRVDTLMATISGMEEAENLDRSFREYDRNVRAIQDTADKIRQRRVALQARASEHAVQWEAEARNLSGRRAQEISQERRREFERSVVSVGESLDDLNEAYQPFLTRLRDLRVLLANDLTRQGVQEARPVRDSVADAAEDLRAQSGQTRQTLEQARSSFQR